MGFYEEVSGARFHTSYVRPGGVALDIPENLLYKINAFVEQFNFRIDEMEDMLTNNRV
jgi:NADH:ubiquinone oxidoreductase subunit D|tara:strand:+ start:271 stop:444 length:174 start_codon:yes stop_codon:yes gene_type:complete